MWLTIRSLALGTRGLCWEPHASEHILALLCYIPHEVKSPRHLRRYIHLKGSKMVYLKICLFDIKNILSWMQGQCHWKAQPKHNGGQMAAICQRWEWSLDFQAGVSTHVHWRPLLVWDRIARRKKRPTWSGSSHVTRI